MKVLLVGATGTIGSAVAAALEHRGHDVVKSSATSPSHPVDLADPGSIQALLEDVGPVDAIACAAGKTPYAPWREVSRESWMVGLTNKFLGQVELVRRGTGFVRQGGSFTLVTGVIARDPIPTASIAAAVNGALEAWVRASALELWGSHRINAVSPTVLTESLGKYDALFPGHKSVDASAVAAAFVRSIEGADSGRVFEL